MDVKNKIQMTYMTDQTRLPVFLPYPRFLLDMDLTQTARVLYALLLDRSTLSRKNGWKDRQEHIYLIYTIAELAKDLGKSHMTIKKALNELTDAGLLEKRKQGFSKPNLLFVRLPAEEQDRCLAEESKVACVEKERDTCEGKESVCMRDRKVAPNQLSNNQLTGSQKNGERKTRSAYGKYQNVFLSEAEYEELKQKIRESDRLIEELSGYMRSTGKHYADHAATLQRWAERSASGKNIPDYTCSEEESL